MNRSKLIQRVTVAAMVLLVLSNQARADVFGDWLDAQAKNKSKAAADQSTATTAQAQTAADAVKSTASKSTTKQSQSISIDHGSTGFVDQSNGSDLLSSAFNLLPVSSGNSSGQSSSGTVTASLYAFYSLATKQDPLQPTVYNGHAGLRTLFFTVGREQQNTTPSSSTSSGTASGTSASTIRSPATSSSSSTTTTTATTPPGTIYGVQWTIWNNRDATKIANDGEIMQQLADIAVQHARVKAKAIHDLGIALCENPDIAKMTKCESDLDSTAKVAEAIGKLSKDRQQIVDKVVKDYQTGVKDANTDVAIRSLVQKLQHRSQFSLSFQTIQRTATSPDDYRAVLIFDRGIGDDWLLTLNGSYDYSNSSKIGGDVRAGRGAFQISRNITQAAGAHLQTPLQVNLSGEGSRQEAAWHYRAQLQLVVPIATGVNLPLSFGYGNQVDVLQQQEKGVYGKFGLTFDFGKLVDGIRGQK